MDQRMMSGAIITAHAKQRAAERFGVAPRNAEKWLRKHFAESVFVAALDNGRELYGWNKVAFVYNAATKSVVTCYAHRTSPDSMRDKIADLLRSELTKIERKRESTVQRIERTKRDLEVERAYCVVGLDKSRARARKLALKARVAAIDAYIAELDGDLNEISSEYKSVAKGIVAYV
jgi:hypothetical protein